MHLVVVLIKVLVVKLYTDAHSDVSRPCMYAGYGDFSNPNQPTEVPQSKVAIFLHGKTKQYNSRAIQLSWYNKYPWV